MDEDQQITVGELRRALRFWDDDAPLFFGTGDAPLTFYRVKDRGDDDKPLLQVEFGELYKILD